jgi:inner membrane protein YidH
MIRGYGDHAANERTYLAWVRTGIAIIAFGFVVEKFNLFMRSLAAVAGGDMALRLRIAGPLGRGEGLAMIGGGAVLIALATIRFVRTTRLIDDAEPRSAASVRAELIFSATLLIGVAGFSAYLLLG